MGRLAMTMILIVPSECKAVEMDGWVDGWIDGEINCHCEIVLGLVSIQHR